MANVQYSSVRESRLGRVNRSTGWQQQRPRSGIDKGLPVYTDLIPDE